jgi:cytochrome P450
MLVNTLDPVEHAELRKTWSQGFTPAALKNYDPLIETRAQQLVERLEHQVGTVDLGKWISYFTYVHSKLFTKIILTSVRFDFTGDIACARP